MQTRLLPALAAALLLGLATAACGSSGNSTSSGSSSSSSSKTSGGSSSSSTDNSSASVTDASGAVLTTDALPSGMGTWTQHSDTTLNNVPNSRARTWTNSTPGLALEIDMEALDSSSTAEAGWSTWSSTISGKVSGGPGNCPSGAPSNCVELNGTSTAHSDEKESIITWQQGNVLVAVVLVNSQGTADAGYTEQVAANEGQLISTVGNG